jgi:AraC-like DNA-binding protein
MTIDPGWRGPARPTHDRGVPQHGSGVDAARPGARRSGPPPSPWRTIEFVRRKYGRELLVDVGWVHDYPTFILSDEPHRLSFHEILLITEGRGHVWLDDACHSVAPGSIVFTLPRQVRRWSVRRLDGLCVFFTQDFLNGFFGDALFIERLYPFAARGRVLPLARPDAARLESALGDMRTELRGVGADSAGLLGAMLYALLVRLNRVQPLGSGVPRGTLAYRFLQCVDRQFRRRHRVADYAAVLGVSPGHLNAVARRELGCCAGQIVRARLVAEARRRLLHSTGTAASIAAALGFEDPAVRRRAHRRKVPVDLS